MSEAKSVADHLGDFLVALAGEDRVRLGETGEALRRSISVPLYGERRPPIVALSAMASMLRHHELAAPQVEGPGGRLHRGPDGCAFGAARLALEIRLEQILEDLTRGAPETTRMPTEAICVERARAELEAAGYVVEHEVDIGFACLWVGEPGDPPRGRHHIGADLGMCSWKEVRALVEARNPPSERATLETAVSALEGGR